MAKVAFTGFISWLAVSVTCAAWAQPGRQRQDRGRLGPGRLPILQALDRNQDGRLSAEEVGSASDALKGLDRNRDGQLTGDELFPARRPGFGPPRRPAAGGGAGSVVFESRPLAKDEDEERILSVLKDLDQNQRRGMMNVPEEDGRLLRLLAETINAKNVVEIGTSSGYSGIWFCLALRKTGGHLTTHEIDAGRAALARKNFQRAGVSKFVTLVEGDAHTEVTKLKEPIDLLFLDADKEGYLDYLDKLLPLVRPGGLIVAHNMNVRQAYPPFVKAITTNTALETLFLHMDQAGVGVSMKKH